MSNVISLEAKLSEILAKDLGVSVSFIEACRSRGISSDAALGILRWFDGLKGQERETVRRAALRSGR
jgi:hypothetical protein